MLSWQFWRHRAAALTLLIGAVTGSCSESRSDAPPVLASRPIPTKCHSIQGRPGIAQSVVAESMGLTGPVQLVRDTSSGYVYVVELPGTIRRYREAEPEPVPELVLDLSSSVVFSGEDGLLGMALETTGPITTAIVKLIAPSHSSAYARTVLARFTSVDGGRTFAPESRQEILVIEQPGRNHRGGPPAFGPDGMLYVPTGDGGFDTKRSSQDLSSLLGKILRIDTRGRAPYAVPADNPFVGVPGARAEIFALGFRNPFGWTFDPDAPVGAPVLWVGDVGESRREEIDRVERGLNYGWPLLEGDACAEGPCDADGLTAPAYSFENTGTNAIVGGPVYVGTRFPELRGRVLIGDNATGRIEAISREPGNPDPILVDESGLYILWMGQDANGEPIALEGAGKIMGFERRAHTESMPSLLSATGCVDMMRPTRAASGLLPYDVNMPLWSDGTEKMRSLSLPANTSLRILDDASFEIPLGAVAVKTFFWHEKPIETRLLVRQLDGEWSGYSYEWRDDGKEAELLDHGKRKDFGDLAWTYPSRAQCLGCHTVAAARTLGLDVAQINRDIVVDGRTYDQLATWEHLGIVDIPLGDPRALPRFPARNDTTAAPADWSRAYLHANCSHCHRPGGPGASDANVLASAPVSASGCDSPALGSPFEIEDARFIAPGHPESSLALVRMAARPAHLRMPPIATAQPDDLAIGIISEWIRGLDRCDLP